jgi:glycosyltransferase involved in cell wall biosynthesis
MKISLIIPAYNEEKYIGECLDYVIKHAGSKFYEIIVIDNASTDKTRAVAEKRNDAKSGSAGHTPIRVVTEGRKGLTQARQRGFLEAKGDVLAYVDADTQMPEGWYETVEREFSKNKNLVCLSGPYIYHDIHAAKKVLVRLYWLILGVPMYNIVGYMVVGGNFAIRKDIVEKMGGFDTSIAFYGEDTNIARRASAHGKVKFKLGFPMHTSGRRFAGQGLAKTSLLYMVNFVSEVVRRKPAHQKYKDIR